MFGITSGSIPDEGAHALAPNGGTSRATLVAEHGLFLYVVGDASFKGRNRVQVPDRSTVLCLSNSHVPTWAASREARDNMCVALR